MPLDHKKYKHFQVGDIVRMNPACEHFALWSGRETVGPFEVLRVGEIGVESRLLRLSDGLIIECGKPTSWWLVLDTFLDAARKAQSNG